MSDTSPRVALITGASSGIGRAAALALAKQGFRVFGTSRRPDAPALPGVTMRSCDVTDDASVADLVSGLLAEAGRIDLLVNNAGVGLFGAAEETSLEQAKALFEVNLFGVIRMTNAVLPTMRQQRQGRIINLSSVMGFVPAPFSTLYAASKHAVEGYSQSLDHELRTLGIRVSLVEPGFTRTAFEENLIRSDRPIAQYAPARSEVEAATAQGLQTGDAPEIVADCIVRVATAAKPRLRYPAGGTARRVDLLRRFAPVAAFDANLRKMFRLPV
ncbi:oxidoreductase [Rhodobacter capsulatus]|uniref:oxidoreductase n=1 Tax=Rhodobacter capsulatus TaxID=1061 RepID=UPI0040257D93